MNTISVIGAGAWGTALAQVISSDGTPVTLWTRFEDHAVEINAAGENKRYLQRFALNKEITASSVLKTALNSEILLMVTPTQALRSTLEKMKPYISKQHKIILCCKGIEHETAYLPSEITKEILPDTPTAVLSGPNFATEIVAGKPAATTLACEDDDIALLLQKSICRPAFRPYISKDITGVQIAGALKNVIAIACGITNSLEMGESARAGLITRGLAEIARLGTSMGAHNETFLGLSGVGDMLLTCSSQSSRNFSLGHELGKGVSLPDIMNTRTSVAEGVYTAKSAKLLSDKYAVDMPISTAVYKCLYENLALDALLQGMLNRPVGYEV